MPGDSAYDSGQTLAALDERKIEAFIPRSQRANTSDNAARRDSASVDSSGTSCETLPLTWFDRKNTTIPKIPEYNLGKWRYSIENAFISADEFL